jgi:tetratricopeptide (TPR) repeat protein
MLIREYCIIKTTVVILHQILKIYFMKLLKVLVVTLITFGATAQGIKVPTKSPAQTIKQEFALSSVEIDYSRPSAKGRKIFGDLEAYGKLWRTGANSQTTINFGEDVKVNGKPLKAGKYTILTVIGKENWKIHFCTPTTSVFNFKESDIVTTIDVKSIASPVYFETFTILFGTQTDTSLDVNIVWENTVVPFTVSTDIDEKVMSAIDKAMNVDSRPYHAAASYYYDNNKDLKKALEWVNKAMEAQPTAFWITHLKAKIQAKAGDKKGALETATKALNQAKNGDYVALNEKLIATLK